MENDLRINKIPVSSSTSGGQKLDPEYERDSKNKLPWIILSVVVIAIVILAIVFRDQLFASKKQGITKGKDGEYQAVFLTNGQVYFGKLENGGRNYIKLTDIYYLQVIQPALQGPQPTAAQSAQSQQEPKLQLVKLGKELHAPTDEMHINRQQVLFYEDMKQSGQVMQAILKNQAPSTDSGTQGETQPAAQNPASQATTNSGDLMPKTDGKTTK